MAGMPDVSLLGVRAEIGRLDRVLLALQSCLHLSESRVTDLHDGRQSRSAGGEVASMPA